MEVLVTGGTGFVGREVVRRLRVTGHRIHLLARHPQSPATRDVARENGARIRPGDVLDADSLAGVCADVDAVIHLVGIISEIREQTFENVHVRGTQNMVFAARDGNVRRFLHMSALGTRPDAPSRYHQSKWAAEDRVRHSSLGWTVFRPSIIYGRGDGFVSLFARIIRFSPLVPILGSGLAKFQPVHVKSVASAFVAALSKPETIGETYDLCGPQTFTLNEFVGELVDVMKRKRLRLHIPMAVVRYEAAFFEWLFPRVFGKAPPLNRDQLLMLQEDSTGNGTPANNLFGLKHVSFREGLAEYLK